jgi:hypothetical protein
MSDQLLVPIDFAVPDGLTAGEFRLEPLGPQHNAADYAAWTASIDHIWGTPGFAGWGWPHEMSQADNLRDLQRHAQDFAERRGFTYTVLSAGTGDVIGCVYIYPHRADGPGGTEAGRHAVVRSWVRADRAALDPVLYHVVLAWLERDWWPFHSIEYAPGHALLSITWELPHGLRCARTSVSGWSASRNPQTSPSRRTARRDWVRLAFPL